MNKKLFYMLKELVKRQCQEIKPCLKKILGDSARGYIFGCAFSVFTPSNKPLLKSVHESGKNFAKMSAAYTTTEILMKKLYKTPSHYNSLVAGAVAGGVGSYRGKAIGSAILGGYSSLSEYSNKN